MSEKSDESQNQEQNQTLTKEEQEKAWMNERKSKRAKKPKIRKHQKSIEGKVEREAINEVEDLLVRTAFSALL